MVAEIRDTIEALVPELRAIRTDHGNSAARRLQLLQEASGLAIVAADTLRAYHDLLLFAAAFPDNDRVAKLARQELQRVAKVARDIMRTGKAAQRRRLHDSGIAHTVSTCNLTVDATNWLAERFSRDTELAWQNESLVDTVDGLLPLLTDRLESDGLHDCHVTTRDWISTAHGGQGSDLAWLLGRLAQRDFAPALREQIFESHNLCVDWTLREPAASRTFCRFPGRRMHYHPQALERNASPQALAREPVEALPLSPSAVTRLLDVVRAALAVRNRETDPTTYVATGDVTLFRLGRGLELVLLGLKPAERLPVETYYGYVLAKNRIPVGYGGGWMFFDRCAMGINVFDEFRGGESAYAFSQILRVYHQCFNVHHFVVEPYQFGAANREAIKSGAFWFYYGLGFRPADSALAALAAREQQRRCDDASYRTPARTLRRLTDAPLQMCLGDESASARCVDLNQLSLAISRWVGRHYAGNCQKARQWAIGYVSDALHVSDKHRWSADEQEAFDQMCLMLAPVPNLDRWPASERRALLRVLKAKGARKESTYARQLQGHSRLRRELAVMAAGQATRAT